MDLLKTTRSAVQDVFQGAALNKEIKNPTCRVIIVGGSVKKGWQKDLQGHLQKWQIEQIKLKSVVSFNNESGPVVVLQLATVKDAISPYGVARDCAGSWWREWLKAWTGDNQENPSMQLHFVHCTEEEILGALVGIGLGSYRFLDILKEAALAVSWGLQADAGKISQETFEHAKALVYAMNLARHWASLPAEVANAEDLSVAVKELFKNHEGVKVDVWSADRVKKEGMGLLTGVGQGSKHGARLVRLSYRPKSAGKKKPYAFVGKGVTFDTGGLDLKNSSGMRLMKKDMSGAAIVMGLCHFASTLQVKTPCDFYMPLAENAVSAESMRPGDILRSRNGLWVEIDNTDAEGRLVMADAFDVALTQKGADEPEVLFDVSTLTGAMRVALGLDCAGFFATDDDLAQQMTKCAQKAGELTWRMPLIEKYNAQLKSAYGDLKNSSDSGFAGAITAALFLKRFTYNKPWVHFDAMAWNTSAHGAVGEGANAQCLQTLAQFLSEN